MNEASPEYQVKRIELENIETRADHHLGMVVAQPLYDLEPENSFKIKAENRQSQIDVIEKCFRIREYEAEESGIPVPFVILPECAIPVGIPDGLGKIQEMLRNATAETIAVAGIEGLKPEEVAQIVQSCKPSNPLGYPSFSGGRFVNLCMVAIRDRLGEVSWYYQAKLHPSRWEQSRNMARGNRILYFHAGGIAFICQICFDHLIAHGSRSLNIVLCERLQELSDDAVALDYVFVPQYNRQPLHIEAFKSTKEIITFPSRKLPTEFLSILFANAASRNQEDAFYGRSSIHYRGNRWQVPTDDIGPVGYELVNSEGVTSAIFRKRTATINTFALVPPDANIGDARNLRLPLENLRSYLIGEVCDPTPCACIAGTPTPNGVYVQCECLPCKMRETISTALPNNDENQRWVSINQTYSERLKANYFWYRAKLLELPCHRAVAVLNLLLMPHIDQEQCRNPDLWQTSQKEALKELFSCLSIFDEIEFASDPQWTALVGDAFAIAILDGDRKKRWREIAEEYTERFSSISYNPKYRSRKTLIATLRSNGGLGSPVQKYDPDYTRHRRQAFPSQESAFTSSKLPELYICQSSLVEGAKDDHNAPLFLHNHLRSLLE